jgi:hypothetical protein
MCRLLCIYVVPFSLASIAPASSEHLNLGVSNIVSIFGAKKVGDFQTNDWLGHHHLCAKMKLYPLN